MQKMIARQQHFSAYLDGVGGRKTWPGARVRMPSFSLSSPGAPAGLATPCQGSTQRNGTGPFGPEAQVGKAIELKAHEMLRLA